MGQEEEKPKNKVQAEAESKGQSKPVVKPKAEPEAKADSKPEEKPKVVSAEVLDLAEKVAGDPKSRLFVKLAEEYLKAEMYEEAITVLNDGLKNHPKFSPAKVMLGRVMLVKGDVSDAKAAFEAIVSVSPDNLLAQRNLAGIYKDEKNIDAGRAAAQTVLDLNPKDTEMLEVVKALDALEEASRMKGTVEVSSGSERSAFEMALEQTSHIAEKQDITDVKSPGSENKDISDPPVVSPDAPSAPEAPKTPEVPDSPPKPAGTPEMGKEFNLSEMLPEPTPDPEPPKAEEFKPSELGISPDSPGESLPVKGLEQTGGEFLVPDPPPAPQEPEIMQVAPKVQEETKKVEAEPAKTENLPPKVEAEPAKAENLPAKVEAAPEGHQPLEELNSEALADLYIQQGHYEKGMAIFRKLLAEDPSNQGLHKKLDEAVKVIRKKSEQKTSVPQASAPAVSDAGPSPGISPDPVAAVDGSQKGAQKENKLERLQSWLDSIKKGQKG